MAQAILTNALKELIVANAIRKAGIPDKKNKLRTDRALWAEKVRILAIGGEAVETEVAKTLKKIESLALKLPPDLQELKQIPVSKGYYITLNVAGAKVLAYFNGNYKGYERGSPDHISKITPDEFTLTADNPLVDEFYTFDTRYTNLQNQHDAIKANVTAALQKVRTLKRLLEEWPEAEELLPADAPKVPPVPAVRREALNEMIGLPTE